MAITNQSVTVNLTSGEVIEVMNNNIRTITGVDGAAVLGIYVNGMGLKFVESDDDITTAVTGLLALAGNFIVVPTDGVDAYINASSISMVSPEDTGSIISWDDTMGDSLNQTVSTSNVAAVKVLIDAL